MIQTRRTDVDRLKHLINQGGLKRGQLCIVAMSLVRSSPPTNNKDLQLIMESKYSGDLATKYERFNKRCLAKRTEVIKAVLPLPLLP